MKKISLEQKNNIAILLFDTPHQKVNTLDNAVLEEMTELVNKIQNDHTIMAALIISGKEDNFIAGADLHEFEKSSARESARELCEKAQALLNKIAKSTKPYIAAIHGSCLGGGLELALACHYRIATNDPKTKLGSPEVLLGLTPAAGGTQRLPCLIGMRAALKMLLSGKSVNAKEAERLGLIDFLLKTHDELEPNAIKFIDEVALKKKARVCKKASLFSLIAIAFAERMVRKKSHGHYPAPFAILEALKTGVIHGPDAGFKKEAQKFQELLQSQTSKNLIRLFFEQKSRQKYDFGDESQKMRLGVIGSGLMGSGIATVSLIHGQEVIIFDKNKEALAKSLAHINSEISEGISRGKILRLQGRRDWSELSTASDLEAFSRSDLIIEAIFEDLKTKQELLASCESIMNKDCIFASNTSSIPIAEIAEQSSIKDRVIGMHYFSPVEKMPLLEIVKSDKTSEDTLKKALKFGHLQGKTIIVVNDSPGFYTTRVISALFDEACELLLEGHGIKEIDKQMLDLGFPMGPLALIDQVGLDVGYHVSEILYERLGKRLISVDLALWQSMINANFLGHKNKQGFYLYKDHKKSTNPKINDIIKPYIKSTISSSSDLGQRMLLRTVNEAALCLAEKVIDTPADGDVGAVFGIGFPPYLGGPFQYIKEQGENKIKKALIEYTKRYGERFKADW